MGGWMISIETAIPQTVVEFACIRHPSPSRVDLLCHDRIFDIVASIKKLDETKERNQAVFRISHLPTTMTGSTTPQPW